MESVMSVENRAMAAAINEAFEKAEQAWDELHVLYKSPRYQALMNTFIDNFAMWMVSLQEAWPEDTGYRFVNGRLEEIEEEQFSQAAE
jgi:hypothetical protein